MNFKLTKELSGAGYPQKGRGSFALLEKQNKETQLNEVEAGNLAACGWIKEFYYVPLLSELVESLGEMFVLLSQIGIFNAEGDPSRTEPLYWSADGIRDRVKWDVVSRDGKTPEEAVARLWIALNK